MVKQLRAALLGNPVIYMGEEMVNFPFSKINALIYYLLVNQTASRDELAVLLWPNKTEASAKKNLRNSIYQANKTLGDEFIVSLANQILALNQDLPIQTDIDQLFSSDRFDPKIYRNEFLHNFYIKGCEQYDLWINHTRMLYENKFSEKLYQKVQTDIENRNFDQVEANIQRLTLIDEFDEHNYQLLMNYYHLRGMYSKVIETYMQLANLLNNELGITPSQETIGLYQKTISKVQERKKTSHKQLPAVYFSRPREVAHYEQIMEEFETHNHSAALVIEGETGNGKTEFVERMQEINQQGGTYVNLQSQKIYAKNAGYIWDKLLQKIMANFDEEVQKIMERIGFQSLKLANEKEITYAKIMQINQVLAPYLNSKHLIITIDQFEQIDVDSLKIINKLILDDQLPLLFIFIGNGQWTNEVQHIIDFLTFENKVDTIAINALTRKETSTFIDKLAINGEPVNLEKKETIYRLSGGNLLFIREMIHLYNQRKDVRMLTEKMKISIEKQCSFLNQEAIEILETLSFFHDSVPISLISYLLGLSTIRLKRELQELFRRNLIEEIYLVDNTATIQIKANRIKYYFYSRQNQTVKRLMHGKIADTLIENQYNYLPHNQTLNQIAYHFRQADRKLEALAYELNYLQDDLKFKHELFPIYNQEQSSTIESSDYMQETTEEKLADIKSELQELADRNVMDTSFLKIEIEFLYIQGRYFIRMGEYDSGIDNILSVIVKAKEINETDFLLRAYLQMIYYCIQTNNAEEMAHYIDFAFELAIEKNDHESIGVILRLKGLHAIMIGEIGVAEGFLNDSVNMLTINSILENKYAINIAAVYDYLSEIALIKENYEESIDLQQKALDYLQGKNSFSSEVVLSLDMGIAQFANKNYKEAHSFFKHALRLSDKTRFIWRRPQLLAFLAVNKAYMGDFKRALAYLNNCQEIVDTLSEQANREIGILNWAKALISLRSREADTDHLFVHHTALIDTQLWSRYSQIAQKELSVYRDVFERRLLQIELNND